MAIKKLLDAAEVAGMLGISVKAARRLMQRLPGWMDLGPRSRYVPAGVVEKYAAGELLLPTSSIAA
jgi:hypothetical protein